MLFSYISLSINLEYLICGVWKVLERLRFCDERSQMVETITIIKTLICSYGDILSFLYFSKHLHIP